LRAVKIFWQLTIGTSLLDQDQKYLGDKYLGDTGDRSIRSPGEGKIIGDRAQMFLSRPALMLKKPVLMREQG
jgi:hypothetical protein